jgi:hypothetical protein
MNDANGPIPVLDILVNLSRYLRPDAPEWTEAWRELATMIDVEGLLDPLTERDARGLLAATIFDLSEAGPARLRERADWVETTGDGARPQDDPAAVAEAMRRVAALAEL